MEYIVFLANIYKIPFIIVGNKVDLIKDVGCSIDFKTVREYSENKESIYIEISARTGEKLMIVLRN